MMNRLDGRRVRSEITRVIVICAGVLLQVMCAGIERACAAAAPVLAQPVSMTVSEGATTDQTLNASDSDGDPITFSLISGATFVTVTTTTPGTGTATGNVHLAPGFSACGPYSVTVRASDGSLNSNKTFAVTVSCVDRPPVLTAPAAVTGMEGALLTFSVTAADPDSQAISELHGMGEMGHQFGDPMFEASHPAMTSGTVTWTPTFDDAGTHTMMFTASNTLSDTVMTTITIVNVDAPPMLAAPSWASAHVDSLLSFTVSANDPDSEAIGSLTAVAMPVGATFTSNAQGTSGTFQWTPTSAQAGDHIVSFAASNALSEAVTAVVNVTESGSDLMIRDTLTDDGTEPDLTSGVMWASPDIWVLPTADDAYTATPFVTSAPPWTPDQSQQPVYRDPKLSFPNYIYVRVRNSGTKASAGTARLRVYWTKAALNTPWDKSWVDFVPDPTTLKDGTCTKRVAYGMEVTKTRNNLAKATTSERDRLRDAFLKLDDGTLIYPDGVTYWDKQNQIHWPTAMFGNPLHGTPAFDPWHRELVNRLEVLLREADPTITIGYWDWTTNPRGGGALANLMTSSFMGATGTPNGNYVGAPFNLFESIEQFYDPDGTGPLTSGPPFIWRNVRTGAPKATWTTFPEDKTVLGRGSSLAQGGQYREYSRYKEDMAHNSAHVYMGGGLGNPDFASQDPFFFLLHSNNDRIWSMWQRIPAYSVGSVVTSARWRLDPSEVYGTADDAVSSKLRDKVEPWAGLNTEEFPTLRPWATIDGQIVDKNYTDPSIVAPPFYDTATLRLPILQPGESVILEMPWYPPNPADFTCFADEAGHVCLYARIEEYEEGDDVGLVDDEKTLILPAGETESGYSNTRNNNNNASRNFHLFDQPGSGKKASVIVTNGKSTNAATKLSFQVPSAELGNPIFNFAEIRLKMRPALSAKWVAGGRIGSGISSEGDSVIKILSSGAFIGNMDLGPDEMHATSVNFRLTHDAPNGVTEFNMDVIQYETTGGADELLGGMRYSFRDAAITDVEDVASAPPVNAMQQNRPNPFNPETVIPYSLATRGHVAIRVYDISGRLVRTLVNAEMPAGTYSVRWNGQTDRGRPASNGIYFYRIIYPDGSVSAKKLAIVR